MVGDYRRHDAVGDRPIHQVRADGRIVGEIRSDTPIFVISVAADLAGMHAQTLRSYDREGLVSPRRTTGGGRRYSQRDIELLQQVQQLSQDEGVNRAGIRRIMELENEVDALRARLDELAEQLADARAAAGSDPSPVASPGAGARGSGASGAGASGAGARGGDPRLARPVATAVVARTTMPGDAVVPWRAATTAIVTWRPGPRP